MDEKKYKILCTALELTFFFNLIYATIFLLLFFLSEKKKLIVDEVRCA